MVKTERIVTAVKTPHEWKRHGSNWKCSVCGAQASEYDDDGNPEPYGLVVYHDLELVEATCEELSVFKVMRS